MLQGLRPNQIFDLILANRAAREPSSPGHARYRPELDWNVQYNQVLEYYHQATERLREHNFMEGKLAYRQSVLRYEDLFRRALNTGDIRTARMVLRDRDALLKLDAFQHGTDDSSKKAGKTTIELPGGMSLDL